MTCICLQKQKNSSFTFDFAGSTAGVVQRGYSVANDKEVIRDHIHVTILDTTNIGMQASSISINDYYHKIFSNAGNTDIETFDMVKSKTISEVTSLTKLKYNWDDEDGNPFTDEEVSLFVSVIKHLKVVPRISPTGRSSLVFDYEKEDGSYLGFELYIDKMDIVCVPENDFSRTIKNRVFSRFSSYVNDEIESFYA